MGGLLHAIGSIPWDVVLIGVLASCATCILPGLLAALQFAFFMRGLRLSNAQAWEPAELIRLKEEIDRAREAVTIAEARLTEVERQTEGSPDGEATGAISRAVEHLLYELDQMMNRRGPHWFKLLRRMSASYLLYLFFFILGVIVTLLITQSR